MGTKQITVSWDPGTNGPTAPDLSVMQADGETTIQWVAGDGVQNLSILDLDANEFTGLSGNGTTAVSATDLNNNPKNTDYNYTISATHKSGARGLHDPKIRNVGRPTLSAATRKPEVQL